MDIDMVRIRQSVTEVSRRREASWVSGAIGCTRGRYMLDHWDVITQMAAELKWSPAYAELVNCFTSVWGYASFDSWADRYLKK
jgi:hypothetical protein